MSRRVNVLLGVFFFLIFANSSHRLASIERAYYREEVRIGAMPAWFVLPVLPPVGRFGPPDAPSPRPPVVIVQHGFSASRQAMDWIVRGLVRNGFAVLAGDFRGHGQNPTPFNFGALGDDIASLITYAQSRPEVNGQQIALVGHSMGAFAVVYATFGTAVARLFFNLTLDSQRFGWFVVVAILFLPLGIGLESALRPAGGGRAVVRSLMAKALILIGLTIAINTFGTLPPVIGLMIPSLAIVLPIIEAVAARLYTVSGSALASGVLTALFLAWIPAAIFPIGH